MTKVRSIAVLALAMMTATIALAIPASAGTIDVFPGESIQEAVHAGAARRHDRGPCRRLRGERVDPQGWHPARR